MSEESFRLPASSYEELIKVIKAYASVQQPVSLDEVSHRTGLNKTVISKNHAFLNAVGLVEGTTKKSPTDICKRLGHALHYEDSYADAVANAWQQVIHENDFFGRMITAVRIRKGMDKASLEGHIAYSAGLPKTPPIMTGARTVIDILRAAQLLVDDNDRLVPVAIDTRDERREPSDFPAGGDATRERPDIRHTESMTVASGSGVMIRVDIRVSATVADLDGLGKKIRAMLADIKHESTPSTSVAVEISGEG